jgi:hypothetical protein
MSWSVIAKKSDGLEIDFSVWLKCRLGCGCGMDILQIAIFCLILVNFVFAIWQTRVLALQIHAEAAKLDENVAKAIQVVLEQVPELGSFEPVNPMQQLIMSMVQDRIKPPNLEVKEVTRDSSGKFAQDTSLNTE